MDKLHGSSDLLIFKATRCLVSLFDGSAIDHNSILTFQIEPKILLNFGFLHFQVSEMFVCIHLRNNTFIYLDVIPL